MKKKLLQISSSVNWGSIGKIAEQIGIKAMEFGWESYIAYGRKEYHNPSKSILMKVGNQLCVYEHYIEDRLFNNEGLASRISTKKFIKQIEQIKPNIIHLHNIHDHWLNYKILFEYLNNTNVPVVWTQHDCWAFTGGCMHFVHSNCDKWKTQCRECPQNKRIIDGSDLNYILKKTLFGNNKNLTIVPVSHWLEDEVKQSFLKNKRINTILNGVDIDVFHPLEKDSVKVKYGIENKFLLIGLATAWTSSKGLKDYVELSKYLPNDIKIMLVGLSPTQTSYLPKSIICVERTSNIGELVELYSAADVVLNLSYAETFGLTTAEGFACGTPGIVYNKTASPELISEGVGYVVEAGNIEQLLSAITIIKNKGKEYYSKNCRRRAVNLYDKNKCFDKYVDLYNELLNK